MNHHLTNSPSRPSRHWVPEALGTASREAAKQRREEACKVPYWT